MKLGNNIQFLRTNMCLSQEELATDDIPANETDDISAIISRYLLFAQRINLNAADTINGLQDIFREYPKVCVNLQTDVR